MNTHTKQYTKTSTGSSFDITLEETLKALYERRLEIVKLLRSLEAQKFQKSGQKLKVNGAAF